MLYVIYAEDIADSLEKRTSVRPAHLARFTGSTVIAEFESLEAAQSWANDDPYIAAGVYQKVSVKPYKKVF